MSHYECSHCGGRFRDAHDCPKDPDDMLRRIDMLETEVAQLRTLIAALAKRVVYASPAEKEEMDGLIYQLDQPS